MQNLKYPSLRNLAAIKNTDSPALTHVLDYWWEYDSNTVILSYAELRSRKYPIPDNLIKKLSAYLEKNNTVSLEQLLNNLLEKNGYSTYDELLEKSLGKNQKIVDEKVVCPKCYSDQITVGSQMGTGDKIAAFIGVIAPGKNEFVILCLKCGNKFLPGKGAIKTINDNGEENIIIQGTKSIEKYLDSEIITRTDNSDEKDNSNTFPYVMIVNIILFFAMIILAFIFLTK
jgi:predicted nucleic-acid-binding Zn-ribbon protein